MKIDKIDDNILKITLTEEELYFDYDLNIDDLVDASARNEVSKKLIEIVKEAADEYNIKEGLGMHLTIRLNPGNEVELEAVFTDDPTEANLVGVARIFKSLYKDLPEEMANEMISRTCKQMNFNPEYIKKLYDLVKNDEIHPAEIDDIGNKNIIDKANDDSTYYILESDSMDKFINVSKLLKEIVFLSSLYKIKNKYYLFVHLYEEQDYKLINIISEFLIKRNDNMKKSFLTEHGELIIEDYAIDKLADI